jgi:hypothetical protein
MMLILPGDYRRIWKEKQGDTPKVTKQGKAGRTLTIPLTSWSRRNSDMPFLRFAEIRKSSGRVGEHRYRYLEDIGSITITEDFTSQKRWYKVMVAYNELGKKAGKPPVEFLYFFIDPWILDRLIRVAEKNKESNHSAC